MPSRKRTPPAQFDYYFLAYEFKEPGFWGGSGNGYSCFKVPAGTPPPEALRIGKAGIFDRARDDDDFDLVPGTKIIATQFHRV